MELPPRVATSRYLESMRGQLDVVFDVDLGELAEGHHVVARGIEPGRPVEVPAADRDRPQCSAAD